MCVMQNLLRIHKSKLAFFFSQGSRGNKGVKEGSLSLPTCMISSIVPSCKWKEIQEDIMCFKNEFSVKVRWQNQERNIRKILPSLFGKRMRRVLSISNASKTEHIYLSSTVYIFIPHISPLILRRNFKTKRTAEMTASQALIPAGTG